jgi:hypothetical protein
MRTAKWIMAVLCVMAVSVALLTAGSVFAGALANCSYDNDTCNRCASQDPRTVCTNCHQCCLQASGAEAQADCVESQCSVVCAG